jgi:hypothetical protein
MAVAEAVFTAAVVVVFMVVEGAGSILAVVVSMEDRLRLLLPATALPGHRLLRPSDRGAASLPGPAMVVFPGQATRPA